MIQHLVIDLDYNKIRGVFTTPQEAEMYVDKIDNRGYRSAGFLITPIEIKNGKIVPQEMKDFGNDNEEVGISFLRGLGLVDQNDQKIDTHKHYKKIFFDDED